MGAPLGRFRRSLEPLLSTLHFVLGPQQLVLLDRHFELLQLWNRKLNLTSLRDPEQIAMRHFGESLFVASILPAVAATLADLGSGAGFPGIPIAVARPQIQVSLVESIGKKAVFLKEVARPLSNAHVLHGRFEKLPLCFHWATIRGVAPRPLWNAITWRVQSVALIARREQHSVEFVHWEQEIPVPWEPSRVLLLGSVRQPPPR